MRKLLLISIAVMASIAAFSQDFSNKGKDFWVGYGYHQQMTNGGGGGSQDMVLYFATEQVTTITISIPATGYTQTITTGAGNNVVTSATIPKTGVNDARLLTEGVSNKGIHITSDKPIVAYAHVYNQSVSGATILFPTNTLGRDYYSVNYKNWSNSTNSNCWFYVVAADTGTTTLQITPSGNTTGGWVGGTMYQITLTQGQVYNVMGSLLSSPNNCNPVCTGVDLTGSIIKSVNTGTGCKKIAVFSGSGRISITCNSNNSSSDNYMVQAMPKTAWGKKYLTVPANGNQAYNFYRVCVSNPATVVKVNGVVTALPLQNNFYYEIPATNQPQMIEGDSAIMVAQYFTSQGACGNGNTGDPEVIYLSAVEQNINRVLWNATPNFLITAHDFNVVLPNSGTAVSSFTLDGLPVTGFLPHPQDANYVYLKKTVTQGFHVIQSDSGFNAIAYGFGNAESYGYNAGTNIKDLYQQIGVSSTYGIETTPSVCTNSPFKFKVSLPYIPDSMRWNFHNAAGMMPNNTNVFVDNTGNIAQDSATIVNGKTLHWYSVPLTYFFTAVGVFPITITTWVPNADCGSIQDIDFDLTVTSPPVANFSWTGSGCVAEPVQFTETTPQTPKPTYHFWWDFGDPASGAGNTSASRNPTHAFSAPGTYTVRFSDITTPGCLSDTIVHQVIVNPLPTATISGTNTVCINAASPVITFTGSDGTPPYTFSYNINGGATQTVNSVGATATINAPTLTAGTFIYTLLSVKNTGSTLCTQNIVNQQATVTVTPDATITLASGLPSANQTVCINTAIASIIYNIGASGTGAFISAGALPAGVTGTFSGGVFTIIGTPTVSGVFAYTISTTGPCGNSSLNGTITVTANSTITLSSAPGSDAQTVCINNPISTISYSIGGGGTGASITAGALPAGVTGSYVGGVFTIIGTPTVSGVFSYTVTTGGPCVNNSLSGTITVNANSTINLSSPVGTDAQTGCVNNPITNITYAIGGGGNNASITAGGLPAGVTGTYAAGVFTISGTPTVAGVFPYTVTTGGPCINNSKSGTITVNANSTITLSSAPGTDAQTVCINTAIGNIVYAIAAGGTGASITAGALPAGVTGSYAAGVFTITGTPTVAGVFNYTVSTTGPCINTSMSGTLTVLANSTMSLSSAPGTNTQTVCINNPITTITYAIGATGTGATISAGVLPTGVNGVFAAGVFTISGTPTVSGVFPYSVTSTGPCVNITLSGTITVNANSTISLASAPGSDAQTVCINNPITAIQYSIGAGGTGASITAGALPAGVTGSYAGGIFTIAGTPTVFGVFNYTVTTSGPCINNAMSGSITVNNNSSITLTSAAGTNTQTICVNNPIVNIRYTIAGGGTGASISAGTLPAGVTGVFAAGIFTISGTPTVSGVFPYSVTSTGPCVNITLSGTITVNANSTISLASAPGSDAQTVCINNPITAIQYSIGAGGTGASITAGALPAGVTGSYAGGIFTIAGTPTVFGVFNYTVTTSGPCINNAMSGSITVNNNSSITLTSAAGTNTQTICVNNPIVNIRYTIAGGGTGASISAGTLPAGVTGVFAAGIFTISGTPTVAGVYPYTVTTAGPCINNSLSGTITVDDNSTITRTSAVGTDAQVLCINTTITNITYAIGAGGTGASITAGSLPAGVTGVFNAGVFTISGTATASGVFPYTVTTSGPCINPSLSGTITVLALPVANFNYTNPSCETRTISFTDVSVPSSGTLNSWAWDFGDPTSGSNTSTSQNPVHTFATAGTYTVTLTVGSTSTCTSNVFSRNVTINARPQAGFMIPEVCINDVAAVFTDTSHIAAPGTFNPAGYDWDFGDGSPHTFTQHGTHLYTNTGLYHVTHIVTSNLGCKDTLTQDIFINGANPTAGFTVGSVLCANDSVAITDISTVNPGAVTKLEIRWDFVNQPTVVQVDDFPYTGKIYRHLYPNFQTPLTKNFTVRIRAYSGTLCFNDYQQVITVNAAPKVQFNPLPDACLLAAPYQITQATEIGGVPGNAIFTGPGVSSTGIFSPLVAGIGTHIIKFSFTSSAGGCTDTLSQPITVIDTATAMFSYDNPVCERTNVSFTDLSTTIAGVTLATTTWDFGDGSPLENHAPGSVFTHVFPAASTYQVKMYTTSTYGCRSSVKTIPVVISPIPKPNFTLDKPAYCIPNAIVQFNNTTSIADGSAMTYTWDFGDPASGPLNNTSPAVSPTHWFSTVGPYSVKLSVRSDVGCLHDTIIQITTIHPQPIASFVINKPSACILQDAIFTDNSNPRDGITTAWNWDMGDGSVRNSASFSYVYTRTDTFFVRLYVTNNFGCNSDTLTKTFPVYAYPTVDAGPDRFVLENGSIRLEPITSGNDLQFLWTPNQYMVDNRLEHPTVVNPLTDMTYKLTVTARGGCARSDEMFVKLLKGPRIPNTFTPNNDGINDKWEIQYLNTYTKNRVQVFTKAGQLVFESYGYTSPWDGTYKGKPLPMDTYYYIIEPNNGRDPITGYVTIVK